MEKEGYDIILWGASGYTGRLTTEYFKHNAPKNLTWALGGKDATKLNNLKKELGIEHIDVVLGDSMEQSSIDQVVKKAKIIVSLVGPYALLGKNLVKACVKYDVHYVDITGEVDFMRYCIQNHYDTALQKKLLIVPACGMDCIPTDIGTFFAVRSLEERGKKCRKVKACILTLKGGVSGGTLNTMFNFLTLPDDIKNECKRPYALNTPPDDRKPGEKDQMMIKYDEDFKWTIPFLMAAVDTRVVRRSNSLLNYHENFTYQETMRTNGIIYGLLFMMFMIFAGIILYFSFTRNIARRLLPKSGEGPSRESFDKGRLKIGFIAYPDDDSEPLKAIVSLNQDPGYSGTAKMLSECAFLIASERDKLGEGGVLTTAAAFGMPLIERLRKVGFTFEVVEKF